MPQEFILYLGTAGALKGGRDLGPSPEISCEMTTRDQIVEAADDLFYRQGYEHTSFSDIANAVQISRGNFYYHFKDQRENAGPERAVTSGQKLLTNPYF
jgi:Bacterial regulatory proteins, tetR family